MMEDFKNGSSQMDAQASIRKRLRPNKVQGSTNLSARLNPDFDHNKDNEELIEEVNPSAVPFDSLSNFVTPKFISKYLQKILQYLKSDQKELYLANISAHEKCFLLKIAQNNKQLECDWFNEGSARVALEILDVVEKNKNVYKWLPTFVDGRLNKHLLVYKKLYINNNQKQKQAMEICPETEKLATRFKDMCISQNGQEIAIPTDFKIAVLNTALKFIKDPTRLALEYPEMPIEKAKFIYSVIDQGHKKGSLGLGFKSMYSSLHETMKSLKEKYEFQISFVPTLDDRTSKLLFEKIPKATENENKSDSKLLFEKIPKETDSKNEIESADLNTSNASSTSSRGGKRSKSDKFSAKQRMVAELTERFMRNSLQRMLDFIESKHVASLDYKDVSVKEAKFLQSMPSICRVKEYYPLFSYECEVLLKRIDRALKHQDFSLQFTEGALCRRTEKRTATFYKTPNYQKQNENPTNHLEKKKSDDNEESLSEQPKVTKSRNNLEITVNFSKEQDSIRSVNIEKKSVTEEEKSNSVKARYDSVEGENYSAQAISSDKKSQISENEKQNSDIKNERSGKVQYLQFQSAGSLKNSVAPTEGEPGGGVGKVRGQTPPPTSLRGRLLKALTTPMECDLAERMMRKMGWEGGALGPRGDGITEPILPALHIAPGAGLGHVRQKNYSKLEFRMQFLQHILSFITSSDEETSAAFDYVLIKKQYSFIKHAIDTFNYGHKITLGNKAEKSLLKQITKKLAENLHLSIDCQLSEDHKKLQLKKVETTETNLKKRKKNFKQTDLDSTISDTEAIEDEFMNIINDIEGSCLTRRAAKKLADRITLLEKIRDFLTEDKETAEYGLDCVLNKKHKAYLQRVLTDINSKAFTKRESDLENELFADIWRTAAGCWYMSIDFSDNKFILKKKCYAKRFTSSALDLPPPKSRDIKNTVIYQNNIPIPAKKYNSEDPMADENHDNDPINDDLPHSDNDKNNYEHTTRTDNNDNILNASEREYNVSNASSDSDISITSDKIEVVSISDDDVCMENCDNETMKVKTETKSDESDSVKEICISDCDISNLKQEICEPDFGNNDINNNQDVVKDENDEKYCFSNNLETESKIFGSRNQHEAHKKKNFVKYVHVVAKNGEIDINLVKLVQKSISNALDESIFLPLRPASRTYFVPLLKCHGIQNSGLMYSCHCEESYDWFKYVIRNIANEKLVVHDFWASVFKVNMKINSFIKENVAKILNRLELYNPGVDTKRWVVLDKHVNDNCVSYDIYLDEKSFKYISENDFSLFVGTDKALFTILWD